MHWALVPYRRYADFEGRSTRTEYWSFQILYMVVITALIVVMIAGSAGSAAGELSGLSILALGAMVVFALGSIVPALAVTVRRFHDQDRSGWMTLLVFIPYAGSIVLAVFMFLSGTRGPNRYGDDPRELALTDVFA